MDSSPPGSSVHGISQAKILPFPSPGDLPNPGIEPSFPALQVNSLLSESESHSILSDSLRPHRLYSPWNSPGLNTGVGSLSLLQGVFPTLGLNPGLLHCRQILYQLNHKGSRRVLEWVACPLSSGSSPPATELGVSCIAGGFFTN